MSERDIIVENRLNGEPLDLVVGIPSYNEADSIAFVVEQVAGGLQRHFSHLSTAIINCDNYSKDGTKEVFLSVETGDIPKTYLSTPPGVKGKGNNFHNLFTYLASYRPRAVVVVDADLRSIRPDWIRCMAEPILDGVDFVTPIYTRNEYDGTITNHLCYPLIYSLLKKNIRQPIGGEFSFSNRLMRHWRRQSWGDNARQYGIDIFLTCQALAAGFKIAQVALGSKVHKPSAPKLGEMFTQVVDTLFGNLLQSRENWEQLTDQPETPTIHYCTRKMELPQGLSIDYKGLKREASQEYGSRRALVLSTLPQGVSGQILEMFQSQRFRISRNLWARIVFSFMSAYQKAADRQSKLEIVEALKPLYFARVISFIRVTLELNYEQSEERILRQAEAFRTRRLFLLKRLASRNSTAAQIKERPS